MGDAARKHGTVGAVALDSHGHLAAATSTGGMTAKLPAAWATALSSARAPGRMDATCAVSATGHGEYFIRYAVGHEIDARMRWAGQSLNAASEGIVRELAPLGGSAASSPWTGRGPFRLPFNSEGMYRAWMQADGSMHTAIF